MLARLRFSFSEFLAVPACTIVGFIALAVLMTILDSADIAGLDSAREQLVDLVFTDEAATSELLGTVAGSLITVTGITFSVLLIAVQQSAASMTHQVFDQFLRRRGNQAFFGGFVGLTVYMLIVLSTTGPGLNPVFGASLGLVMTIVALCLLVVLVYSTIDQMRPEKVIEAIQHQTFRSYERHEDFMAKTRRNARMAGIAQPVRAASDGFVTRIDLEALDAAMSAHGTQEVELHVEVGRYVALGDLLAELRGSSTERDPAAVRNAIQLEPVRDITLDPAFGIEQLSDIMWTTISTSKQNPAPGRLVILTMRDLLGRWGSTAPPAEQPDALPIVYNDSVLSALWDGIESVTVVCSESMQTQNVAELTHALAVVFDRLQPTQQQRTAQAAMRLLSGLGDHVLTEALDGALQQLRAALAQTRPQEAAAIEAARRALASSVGTINSRATRVPS